MKALVIAGLVQGFSTPYLVLIVVRISNNHKIMGRRVNTPRMNVLGWLTTGAMFAAMVRTFSDFGAKVTL